MMPVLAVLAILIAIYSLTIDGAMTGLKYYLMPDFSKFSASTVLAHSARCSIRCRWLWVS